VSSCNLFAEWVGCQFVVDALVQTLADRLLFARVGCSLPTVCLFLLSIGEARASQLQTATVEFPKEVTLSRYMILK
jgi:hypothetical protein